MTLLFIPQVRIYLGWEPSEMAGWWLDRSTGPAFRLHIGRLLLEVG